MIKTNYENIEELFAKEYKITNTIWKLNYSESTNDIYINAITNQYRDIINEGFLDQKSAFDKSFVNKNNFLVNFSV